ncbi:MAG: preprotein translocase subunit SecE [Calditrichia bacterium]
MVEKVKNFLEDVRVEVKKVSWPTHEQLVNSTFVVAVVSALFTIFTFAADGFFTWIINLLY